MDDKKEEAKELKALNNAAKEDKENKENKKDESLKADKKTREGKTGAKQTKKAPSSKNAALSKRALAQRKSEEKNKEIVAEVASIAIIGLCILTVIGVYFGGGGIAGQVIGGALKGFLGFGAYILPFILIGFCIYMFFSEKKVLSANKTILIFVMFFLLIAFLHIIQFDHQSENLSFGAFSKAMYKNGSYFNGGLFGAYLGSLLSKLIGRVASIILIILAFIGISVFITGKSFFAAVKNLWNKISQYFVFESENEEYYEDEEELLQEEKQNKSFDFLSFFKKRNKEKEEDILSDTPEISIRQKVKSERALENERMILNERAHAQKMAKQKTEQRNIPKPTVIEIKPNAANNKPRRKIELAYDTVMAAQHENMEPAKSKKIEPNLPSFIKNRERFEYEKFLEKGQQGNDGENDLYIGEQYNIQSDIDNNMYSEHYFDDFRETDFAEDKNSIYEYEKENIENTAGENVVNLGDRFDAEQEIVLDVSSISSANEETEREPYYDEIEEDYYNNFEKALHSETVLNEENEIKEEINEPELYPKEQFSPKLKNEIENIAPKQQTDKPEQAPQPIIIKPDEARIVNDSEKTNDNAEYIFPKTEFLRKNPMLAAARNDDIELLENSKILVRTLASFNVEASVIEISKGPAVTRYELSIVDGIKVSKILSLADNLALSLAATSIRIEAPIPGKSAVGIEIPNKEVTSVYLSEVICDEKFRKFPSKLAFGIGKDIAGNVVVTDIAKMPHMLIAGATGSGKSVCINTLITSIIYKAAPDEVRLIMIDPKVVELSVYNGIPHLLIPVVTEPDKASGALNWAVSEMMERYDKFAKASTRGLEAYNEFLESKGEKKLPQIVIIIDELADLMMVAAKAVEAAIIRLAQLARAAGIHLIIATQRPSVDVITGLIKANIPSRIAFAVSSGMDSRTIIDTVGAEKLLGKGDMLFKAVDMNKPLRIQGAFVTDKEIERIVAFLKENNPAEYDNEVINKISQLKDSDGSSGSDSSGGSDELIDEVISFIVRSKKCSTSLIQRKFRLGYNRAARIVEELEDRGIIGAENGSKPREVLMDKYQMEEYFTRNAR